MKKILLLAFSCISFYTFSQTLTQSDLPFAGLGWTSGVDTTYADPVPAGGTGQNWNLSGLQYDYVDTSGFMNAAGTPYAGTFAGANLAAYKQSTDEWSYFTSSSTGFYVNGFVSASAPFVINPPQMYVPVPFSYGDMQTNISRVVIDTVFQGFAAEIRINFHADFEGDGSGSLTTPTATYPSTLRVRETMLESDSLLVDYLGNGNYATVGWEQSQKTYFRWFQTGATANYILSIDADSLGNYATRSDYVMQWAVLSTQEIAEVSGLSVFPNPASGKLKIKTDKNEMKSVDIFNSTGQLALHVDRQPAISTEIDLDVSALSKGIYFYCITTEEKQLRGKLIIAR
jgi:hypothetical protein